MESPMPRTSSTVGNEAADFAPDVATQEATSGAESHPEGYTHTRLTALFRDYPGEPVPER